MFNENHLNGAHASQGTTSVSLINLPVIAGAQRDLQEHYSGQTPPNETVLTMSPWLAVRCKMLGIPNCSQYCVEYVRVTWGDLEGVCIQYREDLGYGKSRWANYGHRRTTYQEEDENGRLRTTEHCQCTRMPYHMTDLAHVENGCQAALPRKRIHHEFTHDLRNQRNGLASKYSALHRGFRHRQSVQVCWDSSLDRRRCNPWRKCLVIFR